MTKKSKSEDETVEGKSFPGSNEWLERQADASATAATERWLAEQEKTRLEGERKNAYGMADSLVTIVRIADMLQITYDDAAAIYLKVATAFARAVETQGKSN